MIIDELITHSEDEVVETLVVDALQRPLHWQGEFNEKRKMFPLVRQIYFFLANHKTSKMKSVSS